MNRLAALAGALSVAALALSACNANSTSKPNGNGNSGDTAKIAKGGTLTIYTAQTQITLDPAKSQGLAITSNGFLDRRLTTWDVEPGKAPKYVPDLATTTGTASNGGKTWTYTLKRGLKFSNGQPITSADVKYGIERSFAPELSGGLGYHKSLLVGGDTYKGPYSGKELDSIQTPNSKTIVFHLVSAYGDWPWIASMPAFTPVPKSADTDPANYGNKLVASGPYEVQSYKEGSTLTLVRNKYWTASTDPVRGAGPDKIVFQLGQDDSVAAQQLISDDGAASDGFGADLVPPAQLKQANSDSSAKSRLAISNPGALEFLAMNTKRPALKDVRVRKAIEYAVDKQAIQLAAGGAQGGDLASTLITPGIPGRVDYDLYPAAPNGDVAKAKALLKQAGVKNLSLTIVTINQNTYVSQAEAIQQGLQRVGINVKIVSQDENTEQDTITNDKGDYDLTVASWQPDFPSANGNIQPLFASSQIGGGGYNLARYSNPAVDSLINQATAEVDAAKAQALWAQADKRIMQDAPVVPLIFVRNAFLRGSNVRNFDDSGFPNYPNYLRVSLAS